MENLEGKTILISGVAGFIPGHLAESYLKRGARVIGVDNLITGSLDTVSILQKYKNFTFHRGDVSTTEMGQIWEEYAFDWIFSMASPASPVDFERIPLEIMLSNSQGALNLLRLAQRKGAKFLQASTSEVYGDPLQHPQKETYFGNVNPLGIRAPYDESKRYAETLAMVFWRKYGVDTRLVRIFNTYGPRMRKDDGRVIPNFINQALKNLPLTVYGQGNQTRSFCFVDDLVSYIHTVMTKNNFENIHYPVNIGTTQEFTVLEVAKKIISLCNSKSEIEFRKIGADDPVLRRPDLTRLEKIVGRSLEGNSISIDEGLKRTIEYFST